MSENGTSENQTFFSPIPKRQGCVRASEIRTFSDFSPGLDRSLYDPKMPKGRNRLVQWKNVRFVNSAKRYIFF